MTRPFASLGVLLALGCSSPGAFRAAPDPALAPRVVFASAVDDEEEPVDRLLRASFGQQKLLYIWIKWFDLEHAPHHYRYEVVDGSGRIVWVGETDMSPDDAIIYHGHTLSPVLEAPGTWRFRIYVDGRLRIEPSIEVTAQ